MFARLATPVTTGTTVLTGGALTTGPTSADAAEAVPSTLVAVTMTRSFAPMSATCSV